MDYIGTRQETHQNDVKPAQKLKSQRNKRRYRKSTIFSEIKLIQLEIDNLWKVVLNDLKSVTSPPSHFGKMNLK